MVGGSLMPGLRDILEAALGALLARLDQIGKEQT